MRSSLLLLRFFFASSQSEEEAKKKQRRSKEEASSLCKGRRFIVFVCTERAKVIFILFIFVFESSIRTIFDVFASSSAQLLLFRLFSVLAQLNQCKEVKKKRSANTLKLKERRIKGFFRCALLWTKGSGASCLRFAKERKRKSKSK